MLANLFKTIFAAKLRLQPAEEIYRQQIACAEQKAVLRGLVKSVARTGMNTLEVGSWCGDSAVEIGAVVQAFGGKHYCIDWWKGNLSTHLEDVAKRVDIYGEFWNRIVKEGLEDTVIPIRGKSDSVATVLGDQKFDFAYIDGDHIYEQAKRDIQNYSHCVKNGGVLSGDDCEGRISDFDIDFLKHGLLDDYHETVHCGVVMAVGERFDNCSIDYNIWSVRRNGAGWTPTNLEFEGIEPRRQFSTPLIEIYRGHNFVRYGRSVWALPRELGAIDVAAIAARNDLGLLSSNTIAELRNQVDSKLG